MENPLCETFGIEAPILAFSHCGDVVVGVSRAGGLGVPGLARRNPESVDAERRWIDAHIGGRPYGGATLMPSTYARTAEGDATHAPRGIEVAALAGAPKHAIRHRDAGCDFVIAVGTRWGRSLPTGPRRRQCARWCRTCSPNSPSPGSVSTACWAEPAPNLGEQ